MTSEVRRDQDIEIGTKTDLITWDLKGQPYITPTREYQILVFNHGKLVYSAPILRWTENGLHKGIAKIKLVFGEIPDLTFTLQVWTLLKGRRYISTAALNNAISPLRKRGGAWYFFPKRGAYQSIFKALGTSWKKTIRTSPSPKVSAYLQGAGSRDYENKASGTFSFVTGHSSGSSPYVVTVAKQQVVSVRTPNYWRLCKERKPLPVNPFTFVKGTLSPGPYSYNQDYTDGSFSHQRNSLSPHLSLPASIGSHLSIDENKIIAKLSEKISGNSANLGEDVATAKQTLHLLTNNLSRIAAVGRALRTGNINAAIKFLSPADLKPKSFKALKKRMLQQRNNGIKGLELLSSLWLEYRFGLLPLISDANALMVQFQRLNAGNPHYGRVTSRVSTSSESQTDITGLSLISPLSPVGQTLAFKKTRLSIGIDYTIDSLALSSLSSLGLTAPVALGWELIPFSFVVDWALPIGRALNAFSAFEGLTFMKGHKTYFTREDTTQYISYSVSVPPNPDPISGGPGLTESFSGSSSYTGVRCTRTVLSDFPSPTLPLLKNPVSAIHAANAAALVVQIWGKSWRR